MIITGAFEEMKNWLLRTPWKNEHKIRKNVYLEIGTFRTFVNSPSFFGVSKRPVTQFTKTNNSTFTANYNVLSIMVHNFEKLVDKVCIHIGGGGVFKSWWFPKNSKIGFETILRDHSI